MTEILKTISEYLGLEEQELLEMANKSPKTYRMYTIPKKNVGRRYIFHPSKQTKAIQYAFMDTVLKDLQVHECAFGYKKGIKSPLLKNALVHSTYSYSLHLDFKHFFPSIKPFDLINLIEIKYGCLSQEDKEFIENSLFIEFRKSKFLAIGAPSSPLISNIVMYINDDKILQLAKSISKDFVYTRYADDLVFSTNKKGCCNILYKEFEKFLATIDSPKLRINNSKTVFSSRGKKRMVTGLYVCPNGKISLGRKNKRYVRKMINEFKYNKLNQEGIKYLSGYISFILDVEPDFYNKLTIKYTSEILDKIRKCP